MLNQKLKNNMLELACRICLKMHKERYNIFEHSESDRLPANMIIELMCMQVLKDDNFPKTICSNCLERLNDAYNLKLLATESSIKLHNFCRSKSIGNDLEDEKDFSETFEIKEEPEDAKTEESITEELHRNTIGKGKEKDCSSKTRDLSGNNIDNASCVILTKIDRTVKKLDSIGHERKEMDVLYEKERSNSSPDISSESPDLETESSLSEREVTNDKSIENNDLIEEIAQPSKRKKRLINKSKLLDNQQITKPFNRNMKFHCKLCDKLFCYEYYLVHIRQHAGNAPHKCDVCGKCFVLKSILKQHKQLHATDKQYSCTICGKSFRLITSLRMHRFVHSESKPFKCEVCSKSFKHKTTLRVHVLRHENIRPHVCEICGKAFTDHSALRKHQATHNTENCFTCSICGKSFKSKIRLDCHHKVHTRIKSHACSECGKRFGGAEQLKDHILIHTGAKPFACELCGKTFRQRSCLPRHMRTHTGETPFSCKLCTAAFKFSHLLKNHIKVHHKDVPLK